MKMPMIGREAEADRILKVVDAGRDASRTLLVLGEAGAGKTTLLTVAAERASGIGTKVLTSQGCEGETELSFASLRQLLRPLLPGIVELPGHLRKALETAFGSVAATEPADPMHLRVAVLTVLAEVSRRRPLLLIVDDVQLFDRDSRDVLGFAVRRLTVEPVTMLFAARGLTPPEGFVPGLPILAMGPLTGQASVRLMDAQPQAPAGRARMDVLEQAEGNPLAIIELCRSAFGDASQGTPVSGPPRSLRIQEMFASRLRALPEATQRLVLYAAASSGYTDLATVMAAAAAGCDLAGWEPAEEAALIAIVDGQVGFQHPLVRAASYQGSTARARRQAHADLAAVLADDPARRAWHLAAACVDPDETVAAALEETAELAGTRGGLFAAARAWERAAECSPDPEDKARRYAEAVRAAINAGDPSWVVELYAKVTALTRDRDVLSAAACGAARALSFFGRQREAFQIVMDAADPPPNDGRTLLTLTAVLNTLGVHSGLPEIRRPVASLLDRVVIEDVETSHTPLVPVEAVDAIRAGVLAGIDPVANAPAMLSRTRQPSLLDPLPGPGEAERLQVLGAVAFWADESDLCLDAFRKMSVLLRGQGAMGNGANSFPAMAATLIDTGRWAEADELLAEAWELAVVHKLVRVEVAVDALRVTLRGLRGSSTESVRSGAGVPPPELSWTAVDLEENRAAHVWLLRAAATAATAAGDFEGAYRHLRRLFGDDGAPLHYFHSPRLVADLAAAAFRAGRRQEAATVVAAVREAAGPEPTTRMTLLLHHAEALVGADKDAEQHFRLAVVNPAAEQWPFARALARFHYAQWLRRHRHPSESRALLTAAWESFSRLGAEGMAGQARAELRASGVAMTATTLDPLSTLTAHEEKIVRMAARGLSNREIAERFVVSPRTIGAHLYRVYPKLGVSSRHQLRDFFNDL
ncbi:DNA-binding CsgD family transcriptional regulator/tetratricopeptide (TPR) repeat protein [Catenulispora sp. GP43]|uniref:helix-turn-helix transcriptional regulator n=1 Tax=Catenulispora sp. GP43 TaxID=3156263 RepID=UPI003515FED8